MNLPKKQGKNLKILTIRVFKRISIFFRTIFLLRHVFLQLWILSFLFFPSSSKSCYFLVYSIQKLSWNMMKFLWNFFPSTRVFETAFKIQSISEILLKIITYYKFLTRTRNSIVGFFISQHLILWSYSIALSANNKGKYK